MARKCHRCGRIVVPPRMFCELCFRPTDEWVHVKDTGVINIYSIFYLAADATRVEEPILVAVIELDGASKGIGIFIKEDVKFGTKVKAVWNLPKSGQVP